jgi:hypothetical protein
MLGSEMKHFNKKNERRLITTAILAVTMVIGATTILSFTIAQTAHATETSRENLSRSAQAPVIAWAGESRIYIAWSTNNTENGNEEVMFRVSDDSGATFGDRINISNTTDADSWRVEIAAEGGDVIVAWWETNQTSDTPVARISDDGGQTFGPMLTLATNGTIGSIEAEAEEGGETVEEEAVGGTEVAE